MIDNRLLQYLCILFDRYILFQTLLQTSLPFTISDQHQTNANHSTRKLYMQICNNNEYDYYNINKYWEVVKSHSEIDRTGKVLDI